MFIVAMFMPFYVYAENQSDIIPLGTPAVNQTNNTPQPTAVSTLKNPLKVNSIGDLVKSVLQVFSYIAVLFGVVMLIVVGFKYILSQGKPEEMKKASNELLYIVIGLAIVIGARVAVDIVINTMSSTGVIDPNVIQSAKDANK